MTPKIGERVEITQTILQRDKSWDTTIRGVVKAVEEKPTGSWYAHGMHGRLWLGRIRLQKDDGEVTTLALDQNTRINVLEPAAH